MCWGSGKKRSENLPQTSVSKSKSVRIQAGLRSSTERLFAVTSGAIMEIHPVKKKNSSVLNILQPLDNGTDTSVGDVPRQNVTACSDEVLMKKLIQAHESLPSCFNVWLISGQTFVHSLPENLLYRKKLEQTRIGRISRLQLQSHPSSITAFTLRNHLPELWQPLLSDCTPEANEKGGFDSRGVGYSIGSLHETFGDERHDLNPQQGNRSDASLGNIDFLT